VLNAAALVPQGRLLLKAAEAEWERVSRYAAVLSIRNIERVGPGDSFLAAEYFITDRAATVERLQAEISQKERVVLAYFDEAVPGSKELLYALYARFWVRRVAIVPSFYFGFEVFDHFLWSSEHPKGFFELQKLKYVVFQFWAQSISEMSANRVFSVQEIIRANSV
jgi:hypothetical protein